MQTSRIRYRLTKTQPPFSREEKVSRGSLKKGVETGNYYYGARYYDPKISVWLSVDPLAHKYPNLSPYVFTGNNPIMLVDPDGRDIWEYDKNGDLICHEENTEIDQIFVVDGEGNELAGISMEYGTITNTSEESFGDGTKLNSLRVKPEASSEVFEFFADNTNVEWGELKSGEHDSRIFTNCMEGDIHAGRMFNEANLSGEYITEFNHSHPNGYDLPSGAGPEPSRMAKARGSLIISPAGEWGDIQMVKDMNSIYDQMNLPHPRYNIYVPRKSSGFGGNYNSFNENTRVD